MSTLNHRDLTILLYEHLRNSSYNLHDDATQEQKCKLLATKILSSFGKSGDPSRSLDNFQSKWLTFQQVPTPTERKTKLFRIYNTESGILLGEIKWFGTFRAYSFFPAADCIFETTCLGDISDFILLLMQEWRVESARKKAVPVKNNDVLK